ncbi:polysaccharide biosynthesis/export family protein [Singulisphaera sp. PoT]|uniref:polysaccharide biosynthesis/export family protein n=1 Tax=Singulisphaera sp. PoT TaxID=3411797 RepID=UPI003BF580C1
MERARKRRHGGVLIALSVLIFTGCQTVRTPEEKIAKTNLPREFQKVAMPDYVVEPPDILIVEVLEALPGRPITNERLVRPDGKISLGFYGEVEVVGLTTTQIKEKIVLHLRKYLTDEALGLWKLDEGDMEDPKDDKMVPVEPKDSNHVFVDIAAYNSKVYYVQGDVAAPGRMPITGNETVLDAIQYAGGLLATAAPQNIRLVRPAPPGACCEQTLPVNLAAIVNGGDPTTNYQIMPGDRLMVFRDPIVRTTIFIDRLAAPFQTVVNSVLQYSFAARSAKSINTPLFSGSSTTSSTTAPTQPGAR